MKLLDCVKSLEIYNAVTVNKLINEAFSQLAQHVSHATEDVLTILSGAPAAK